MLITELMVTASRTVCLAAGLFGAAVLFEGRWLATVTAGLLRAVFVETAGLFFLPAVTVELLSTAEPLSSACLVRGVLLLAAFRARGGQVSGEKSDRPLLVVDLGPDDDGNDERRGLTDVRACFADMVGVPVQRRFTLPRVGIPFSNVHVNKPFNNQS